MTNKKEKLFMWTMLGGILGITFNKKKYTNELLKIKELSDKHLAIIKIYDEWFKIKQSGRTIVTYFSRHNIHSIAIYGMSFLGERLNDELKNSDVKVQYGIDRNADHICEDIEVILPEEHFKEVDAIVVSAIFYFDEIEETLRKKTDIPILSLEDIIFSS